MNKNELKEIVKVNGKFILTTSLACYLMSVLAFIGALYLINESQNRVHPVKSLTSLPYSCYTESAKSGEQMEYCKRSKAAAKSILLTPEYQAYMDAAAPIGFTSLTKEKMYRLGDTLADAVISLEKKRGVGSGKDIRDLEVFRQVHRADVDKLWSHLYGLVNPLRPLTIVLYMFMLLTFIQALVGKLTNWREPFTYHLINELKQGPLGCFKKKNSETCHHGFDRLGLNEHGVDRNGFAIAPKEDIDRNNK